MFLVHPALEPDTKTFWQKPMTKHQDWSYDFGSVPNTTFTFVYLKYDLGDMGQLTMHWNV